MQSLNRPVNFIFGIKARKTEPDSPLFFCTECFVHQRCAVGTCTDTDFIVLPKHITDGSRAHIANVEGDNRCTKGRIHIAVNFQVRNIGDTCEKTAGKADFFIVDIFNTRGWI